VLEVGRPKRPRRRGAAKTDALDAIRAAREALTHDHMAAPRQRGDREALRVLLTTRHSATVARVAAVNQLKALSVGAPEELRAQLRGRSTAAQVTYCAGLQAQPGTSLEHRMTVRVLRSTARRVRLLAAEAAELEGEIAKLVAAVAPWSSSLVAGPSGWVQDLNFVVLGAAMIAFAIGLHLGVLCPTRWAVLAPGCWC
jgi:transposase